jgi:short-subunit dehydrogenase
MTAAESGPIAANGSSAATAASHAAEGSQVRVAGESVLVVGATSGIARALVDRLAARGCKLILAARDHDEVTRIRSDLRIRHGVDACVETFDAGDLDELRSFVARCLRHAPDGLDGLVIAHGYMCEQDEAEHDPALARRMLSINLESSTGILLHVAEHMAAHGRGWIAGISSVAGDRGRGSNAVYGASKAGFTALLSGMRARLRPRGVHVLTIKPGFVATPMTAGTLDPNSPMVASPEKVAADIDRAIRRRRDVLYTPWFWRWIMLIIRVIPEPIFKRLKI